MDISPNVSWAQRTSPDLARDAARATLIVPIGATEQHGPHLPVGVDAFVAGWVASAAAERATTPERPVYVAPVLSYGSSHHHLPRGGTLSLSSTTMLAVLRDIIDSAAETGIARVVLVNGHFGNEDLARQAARDVALRRPIVAAAMGYWSPAWADIVRVAREHGIERVPGHAGAFETSLIRAIAEHLIQEGTVPVTATTPPFGLPGDAMTGVLVERHGWVDVIGGFTDAADGASAAAGKAILEAIVAGLADMVIQVSRVPVPGEDER